MYVQFTSCVQGDNNTCASHKILIFLTDIFLKNYPDLSKKLYFLRKLPYEKAVLKEIENSGENVGGGLHYEKINKVTLLKVDSSKDPFPKDFLIFTEQLFQENP